METWYTLLFNQYASRQHNSSTYTTFSWVQPDNLADTLVAVYSVGDASIIDTTDCINECSATIELTGDCIYMVHAADLAIIRLWLYAEKNSSLLAE